MEVQWPVHEQSAQAFYLLLIQSVSFSNIVNNLSQHFEGIEPLGVREPRSRDIYWCILVDIDILWFDIKYESFSVEVFSLWGDCIIGNL